ncbi:MULTISPECIES: cyclodeaminase/cyclohydrolase family protein [unclassified Porphyromonas]|uniref:cyclodeaminase/cyclohydrolase family protein n=1 Tax=unclassified Porphyromonas TaxID=2645799 RepID=UPI00052D1B28|nr:MULTISPECIES: cyclodeaminase/cyclohydrolase family protein [unclassified Porphyromonas]KGN84587.1 methenyltetrahydrofolate cyclohydrolase [Porphyromonas sp. COT-290 OH860]KGO01422.1 methenyltetrahydrofolate cyclohydrolase [Porphyromonas sp. COT-290 OH3588]
MLKDLNLQDFILETAGSEPVPGGGSISALNGAIAGALAQMVANLTIGKKRYVEVEEEMRQLASKAEALRTELVADIDRDSDAYRLVFEAFKLPKETDEEKAYRTAQIQERTKLAANIPMAVARRAHELLSLAEVVVAKGNSNAITDGCVAMMCARTAVLGALLNVRINLTSITDEAFVRALAEEADRLEADAIARERAVFEQTKTSLQ